MTVSAVAPLVVDVRPLIGKPGAYERIALTAPAGSDLRNGVVAVDPSETVHADLLLESVREGILVTGSARTVGTAECSRCLDPVSVPLRAEIQELYAWSEADAEVDELGEAGPHLDENLLDVRPAVRDGLILEMPRAPLCAPQCRGLCPQCGARLADDPQHRHETTDPRWAALAALKDGLLNEQADATKEK
jgi:uncharacterized protein